MTISRNLSFLAEGASSTGVLSVSYGGTGNVTLTAGYIPYGNGTGAFNSSANLYFSGTQLGVGTSSPNAVVHAYSSTTNAGRITIQGTGSTAGNYRGINLYNASGFSGGIFQDEATNALSFWNSAAPLMTLDNSGNLSVTGTIKTGGYTVAGLPAGVTGARTYVTNALAPSYGATVVGGGAVTIPVFYNGTNWIVA